jgi:hypothetical protein
LDYINFLSDWRWYLKVGGRFFNLNVGGNVVRNHYFLANNIGILLKSQCYDPIFSAKLAVFFTRMPTFRPIFCDPQCLRTLRTVLVSRSRYVCTYLHTYNQK